MNSTTRRALTALAAALAVLGLTLASASASVAGFPRSCYPKPGTYASMKVDKYPIATGYRYKVTVKGDTGPTPDVYAARVDFNGSTIWKAANSGTLGPVTIYRDVPTNSSNRLTFTTFQPFDLFPDWCDITG